MLFGVLPDSNKIKKNLSLKHISLCVYTEEYEKQDGESPKRRSAVAEERQRDADNRR